MRELPEVETIRRALDKEVGGKKIKTVEVPATMVAISGHPNKKHLIARLEGAKVRSAVRKGLHLLLMLDNSNVAVISLGDGGLLLRAAAKDPLARGTQVVITFTQGGQLRFVDESKSAWISVVPADDLVSEIPDLAGLGLDPVESPVSWTFFAEMLRNRTVTLKAFLVDQSTIAGLGALYADEILFAAGLRPDRQARSLTTQEIRRLYRSLVETLHDAIKYRGTSLGGSGYVDVYGKSGEYQQHLQVYGREKEACRRCRSAIVKVRIAGGATFMCEQCQV